MFTCEMAAIRKVDSLFARHQISSFRCRKFLRIIFLEIVSLLPVSPSVLWPGVVSFGRSVS